MWYFTSNFQKNLCPGKATRITMQSDLNSICSESLLRLSSQRKETKQSVSRERCDLRETGVHFPIPFRSVWSWARGSSAPPPRLRLIVGNRSGLTGYRSNRSDPVPVWVGTKSVQIQNLNLNSKK